MARPEELRVTDEGQLAQLARNLKAMEAALGEPLHKFRRRKDEDEGFAGELREKFRPVYDATVLLPSDSTLYKYHTGRELPTLKAVEQIAAFCFRAFAFERPMAGEELLTRELGEFPPMLRTGRWQRYEGLYRCFYFYPDLDEDVEDAPQLHGGLLRLWEEDGTLRAFLVTGIRRDARFAALEELIGTSPAGEWYERCQRYNDTLSEYENRLVFYGGAVELQMSGYFLLQLPRMSQEGHHNAAMLLLRRWEKSAHPRYTGGIASVTLCRGDDVTCYPMALFRQALSLEQDGDFVARHLKKADPGARGMKVTKDVDKSWNRTTLERLHKSGR